MQFITSFTEFFNTWDNFFPNTILCSFILTIIYVKLFYLYLFKTNKLEQHFNNIKNESNFFQLTIDSIMLAMVEQACFIIYFYETLNLLISDVNTVRFIICLLFSIVHTLHLNKYYEFPIIFLKLSSNFIMCMLYTRMLPLYSFLLHVSNNLLGVLITFIVYELVIKKKIGISKKINLATINGIISLNDEKIQ